MKILLVGWEGVDGTTLRAVLKAGRVGSLAGLSGGRLLELSGLGRTSEVATGWTSLVTGKRPTKHRVLSGLEVAPREAGLQAIGRFNRHAKTVWEIVQQAGQAAHAANWPASHPPGGSGAGIIVSDHFFTPDANRTSVFPAGEFEKLKPLKVGGEEIDAQALAPLLPPSAPAALVAAMRTFVAAAASVQAVATTLLEHRPAESMAVRFPAVPDALRSDAQTPARTVGFLDLMLGRLAELAGRECCVVLACMAGGGGAIAAASADVNAQAISVFDVVPTLLAKLGIAAGADMDGRASDRLIGPVQAAEPRLSWEPASVEPMSDSEDDDAVAHLLALGYREQPDRYAQHAIARHRRQECVRLALAYLDGQDPQRAAELLEPIAEATGPFSLMVHSTLAEAYIFCESHTTVPRAGAAADCGGN